MRAFSEEKHKNLDYHQQTKFQDSRMVQLEREVIELKAENVRLHDSDIAANREVESLRERNTILMNDQESMRKQMRAQEEAIIGAQQLKVQTDHMIVDYERLKQDLNFNHGKNSDLTQNLNANVVGRRKAEDELFRLAKEFEDLKNK